MNQATLNCCHDCLGAVTHVQANENRADMTFYSGFGDPQHVGNIFVAVSTDKKPEYFQLSGT